MTKNLTLIVLLLSIFNFSTCTKAKNLYAFPVLNDTSGKFDTFMIDFKGVKTPFNTFWALCNWQMDLTDLKKTYTNVKGGEGQGGFQNINFSQNAVLSLWDIFYTENGEEKKIVAEKMYPSGADRAFRGFGTGMNFLYQFSWQAGRWYRFVIKSWKDAETGKTFVGEWVQDIATERWELISYFNTNLSNSYIIGTLSQFQENYDENLFNQERSFQIKNVYAYDLEGKKWISLSNTKLHYDPSSRKLNTAGTHDLGFTDEYFYGSSGLAVDDQDSYDSSNPKYVSGSIKQNSVPEFQDVSLNVKGFVTLRYMFNVSWSVSKRGTPCYSYTVKVTQNNNVVQTYTTTRPEETSFTFTGFFSGFYQITVEAVGIFGQTVSKSVTVMA